MTSPPLRVLFVSMLLGATVTFAQEPSGGMITDLVFFDDLPHPKSRFRGYGVSTPALDSSVVLQGSASYRYDVDSWAGLQIFWYGTTNNGSQWAGPDTAVFWAQETSYVRLWVRSTHASGLLTIRVLDNLASDLGIIYQARIPVAESWFLVEALIPQSMRNIPLKRLNITTGDTAKTVWIDDFKISNVRLYAGKGAFGPANMAMVAASQLGYPPLMRKQFSSPVPFATFDVVRTSDNAIVFTGGEPARVDSDAVIDGTVWIGDFSAVTTPGRYKIVAGGRESYPFDIRGDVFDQATRAVQRFFYYQRSFTAIEPQYAEGPWHHPTDAAKAPPGVVKGWHDAGDLTVYNATMTQALYWMLEAWLDFRPMDDNTNIPESGNSIPDLLDETRWGLEWLLSMQDTSGGFWMNATAANGYNSYPYGQTFPHTVTPYIKTVPPCIQATAKATAVLAHASKAYAEFDSAFAASCLTAARRGWAWILANPTATYDGTQSGGPNFNIYAQGTDNRLLRSNKMWAAAALLFATGETQYADGYEANYESLPTIASYSRSEAFAASLYLRATTGASESRKNNLRSAIFSMASSYRAQANNHPFQFTTAYYWGCTSNGMHFSGNFFWKAFHLDNGRLADRDQAMQSIDYIFGRNFMNQCYVSGIDGVSKPRLRGFHHWMKALNTTPWHFPGALAGGPNEAPDAADRSYPNNQPFPIWGYWGDTSNARLGRVPIEGRFTDNDSWSTNEVAVNWNAALLYNLHGARMLARGVLTSGGEEPPGTGNAGNVPREFELGQNYPNPFNPRTSITVTAPRTSTVRVEVFNILGQRVRTLFNGLVEAGKRILQWDGTNDRGEPLGSGMYVYRLEAGDVVRTRKMMLLK